MKPTHNPLAVYVHIPFCHVKCTYCAFNTYIGLDALVDSFVEALIEEIKYIGRVRPSQRVGTIFFGGGTPSVLTPAHYTRIFAALHDSFAFDGDAEISLEVNPADVSYGYLRALREIGFNRISIGMQSANAHELRLFNRRHDNDAVARAVSAARGAGFGNLNLDLMYGNPHQTMGDWENSLQAMLTLKPDHVSLYALTLEEGTPMQDWVEKGRVPEPDDDLAADMYDFATAQLGAAGYVQYEISNWAKAGHECAHNLQYWRNMPYLGLGPGAHGFANGVRYSVLLSPQRYIKTMMALDGNAALLDYPLTPVVDQVNVLTQKDEITDTLLMGLRLIGEGVPRQAFRERFGIDLLDLHGDLLRGFAARGLIAFDDERVKLTDQGRLLSNLVFRALV